MGLSKGDINAIKGSTGAVGKETRPGRTQCRKKEGVFNTPGHKATQTEGRDPKMHLKETLGLEKLKKKIKSPQPLNRKRIQHGLPGAVHPRCEWRRREQAQGGNFMPGLTLKTGWPKKWRRQRGEPQRNAQHQKHLP